jgi:hypothetical protein
MVDTVEKRLQDSGYSNSYQKGKSGIKNQHRDKIRIEDTRKLKGSMDIDEACKDSEPNSPRWDYMVVIWKNSLENLALIEIHPAAKYRNVAEVIEKKNWLNQWLYKTRLIDFRKKFIWIATGSICITSGSKYAKRLAVSNISTPRKVTPHLDTQFEYI